MILFENLSGTKINVNLNESNKLHLETEKSNFNLNCLSASEFPLTDENFNQNEFSIKSKDLLNCVNVNFQFQMMKLGII